MLSVDYSGDFRYCVSPLRPESPPLHDHPAPGTTALSGSDLLITCSRYPAYGIASFIPPLFILHLCNLCLSNFASISPNAFQNASTHLYSLCSRYILGFGPLRGELWEYSRSLDRVSNRNRSSHHSPAFLIH